MQKNCTCTQGPTKEGLYQITPELQIKYQTSTRPQNSGSQPVDHSQSAKPLSQKYLYYYL